MVSLVTPGAVLPPLSPTNFGMHGGDARVMFSCSCPPGAHLLLSPLVGRPSASTDWPAVPVAAADDRAPAVPPVLPVVAVVPARLVGAPPPCVPTAVGAVLG